MNPSARTNATAIATTAEATCADDGDARTFCSSCSFGRICLPNGYDKAALHELHCLVDHVGPYRAGHHLFRVNDAFTAIYSVRAGVVKTYVVDDMGREQVTGFFLAGELVGLNAIYPARYPCNALALDTVALCRFSFPAMVTLATRMPQLQEQLFRLLSKDIGTAAMLAGDYTAEERLAAFLIDLSDRYAARGFSARRLRLSMPRSDIANYLRLAAETVSRVFGRLQTRGLVHIDGREVELRDCPALRHIARCVLQHRAAD